MKILLGITGSKIDSSIMPKIIDLFKAEENEVNVVLTKAAERFSSYSNYSCPFWIDGFYLCGKCVPSHQHLKDWADILLIAPLTANTLAKIANGISDNLLTTIIRSWKAEKPIIVAPSMDIDMWNHPITKSNISSIMKTYVFWNGSDITNSSMYLHQRNFIFIDPIIKDNSCKMADITNIVSITNQVFKNAK